MPVRKLNRLMLRGLKAAHAARKKLVQQKVPLMLTPPITLGLGFPV